MGTLERILEKYWPEDNTGFARVDAYGIQGRQGAGRPSFICATTSHGLWRKSDGHFVHAGRGTIQFGVVPNASVIRQLTIDPSPDSPYEIDGNNPLLHPLSLTTPSLSHLPPSPITVSLRTTISALLSAPSLRAEWLPLPTFQIAQLQKLAVNTSVNALTAVLGVNNGALVGSPKAREIIESVAKECSEVFSAHLAREEGRWEPPPIPAPESYEPSSAVSRRHPPPPPLPASHPLSPSSLTSHTLLILFKTSSNTSSTLADLLATSPILSPHNPSPTDPTRTEIDYMHGYVEALGRRYSIPTPVTSLLGGMVLLKEEMIRSGATDKIVELAVRRKETQGKKEEQSIWTRREGAEEGEGKEREHKFDRGKRLLKAQGDWRKRDMRMEAARQKRERESLRAQQ
ncbi:hypothetical protein P7C70_g5133, partial [Phenoliferia sp. Uapishka_3]